MKKDPLFQEARAGAQGLGQTAPGKRRIRVKKTNLYEAHTDFTADMLIDLNLEAAKKDLGGGKCAVKSPNRYLPCWQQPPGLCKVSHSRLSMAIDRSTHARMPRNVGQGNLVRAEGSVQTDEEG